MMTLVLANLGAKSAERYPQNEWYQPKLGLAIELDRQCIQSDNHNDHDRYPNCNVHIDDDPEFAS